MYIWTALPAVVGLTAASLAGPAVRLRYARV